MTIRPFRIRARPGTQVIRYALVVASLGAQSACADIAYDTLSGHTTGTLRGFAFGSMYAEDITLEPGAGRTLVGMRMAAYSSTNYFGTMRMMFATRAIGEVIPDLDSVFATVDITVASSSTVLTWIADLPFVEAPHQRLWVMWSFGPNTLGGETFPSVGADGGPPTAGATSDTAYVRMAGFDGWSLLANERWVMRLDAIPAPGSLALLLPTLCTRRRRL